MYFRSMKTLVLNSSECKEIIKWYKSVDPNLVTDVDISLANRLNNSDIELSLTELVIVYRWNNHLAIDNECAKKIRGFLEENSEAFIW